MHRQQRGVTAIGWLFLLIPIAIVGYAGIRLAPVYLNYAKVARVMENMGKESTSSDSLSALKLSLSSRLNVEGVTFPETKDFVIRRDGQNWVIEIDYEDPAPLFSNLSIVGRFAKTVRVGSGVE